MNEFINKRRNIVLIIVGIFAVLGIVLGVFFFIDSSKKEDKVDEKTEEDNDIVENDDLSFYVNSKKVSKINKIDEKTKLYAVDIDSGTDEVLSYAYDGYYITEVENVSYLKRKQKVVAELKEENTFVVYRDESDKNSKYVAVSYTRDSGFDFAVLYNDTLASGLSYDDKEHKAMSIIYNINTGKYKIFKDDSYLSIVEMNNNKHFTLEKEKYYFINPDTFELIDTGEYEIVGDSLRMAQGDSIISYSSKYVVAMKNDKYGILDYTGKVIIDCIYDDLITLDDEVLLVGNEEKYGVINFKNEIIVELKYDFIYGYENYYVVGRDGNIGILDSKGSVLVPINIPIDVQEEFNLRFSNSAYISIVEGRVVVDYTNLTNDTVDVRKYIIISEDGKYELKEGDYYGLYYNFSDQYFYALKEEDKISFYNNKNEVLGNMECSSSYGFSFYDDKTILFMCMDSDTDTRYFDINTKEEVKEEDLREEYSDYDISLGNLSVYTILDKKLVVDYFTKELIFRLDKEDSIYWICDNFYKIVYENGSVEYYEVYY